ncbi:hypothetical protein [Microbacterium sp. Ld14]|uniref:hypothetical protein n=1 Tax=Microbacterium sp. Ld14 TaxID=649156 RepID=UPI00386CA044
MSGRVHTGLTVLGLVFTAYLAAAGLFWTSPVEQPPVFFAALVFYLAVTWLCVLWDAGRRPPGGEEILRRDRPLPLWAGALALIATVAVPSATWYAVGPAALTDSFATWTLGGVGALLTIVMVRRRPVIAWIGVIALAVTATAWIGVIKALTVGAAVWVVTAQLLSALVDRAGVDQAELAAIQRRSSEWLATQEGRRRERRVRVQHALEVAGPVLTRTIEKEGRLDDTERQRARLAEGALRDELRGPRLLDESVRARLHEARSRGSIVTVLDEGGLDGASGDALDSIRADLANVLEGAESDRIYIRTSPHESVAVTVVGRSRSEEDPDGEEVVDLWREISHPLGEGPEGEEEGEGRRSRPPLA